MGRLSFQFVFPDPTTSFVDALGNSQAQFCEQFGVKKKK